MATSIGGGSHRMRGTPTNYSVHEGSSSDDGVAVWWQLLVGGVAVGALVGGVDVLWNEKVNGDEVVVKVPSDS